MNKNGHHYTKFADLDLIVKIENLWMIIHQKPYVLVGRVIIFCMAKGLVCEFNVK
jgi:hypothetical protein